jgi:sugar O-acyltransferase (sialic acid O-acetyltransferase NeuD family)
VSEPLFILGTSGHAHDVASVADALGWRPVFVTHDAAERDGWRGADEIALETDIVNRPGAEFAMGIGDNGTRARVAAKYGGLRFPALIHPDSSFGRGQRAVIEAARGTIVFAGVRFTSNIRVGIFCTFNMNVTVSHDCDIGDFANLSPGANVAGNVRVGRGAWIGIGAAVNQGTDARKLTVGDNTIIGSGAVVIDDCEPDSVYVGVPARKIK